jgi:hypothetical protein
MKPAMMPRVTPGWELRLGSQQRRLLDAIHAHGPLTLREIKGMGFRKRTMMSLNFAELVRVKHVNGKIFLEATTL